MIRPIGKNILVKAEQFKKENVSESGIVFQTESTNTFIDSTSKAKILDVGDEVSKVRKGEVIYFETHGGNRVIIQGEEYIILQEINVLGVEYA